MMRASAGLAILAFASLTAGAASGQTLTRDKLLLGAWASCSVTGSDVVERANIQFEPGGVMLATFFNKDPNAKLSFVLSGLWAYDRAADTFSHTVRGARITDMVVRGTPIARTQFPGGESAIAKIEDDFMAQYSSSTYAFTTVTETELVLTDSEGAKVSCTRQAR